MMDTSAHTNSQAIDELLAQLRVAGQRPPEALLGAIRSQGMEAVPSLIAMVSDPAEYEVAESDTEDVTGWAPYSAVKILGELHPPEALEPLLALFPWDGYDYLSSVLTRALGQFGEPALDPLMTVLSDLHHTVWTRWRAADALKEIAQACPDLVGQIIPKLITELDRDEDYEDVYTLRGALVSNLVDLRATEAIPSVIRAYEEERLDEAIISWGEVRSELEIPPDTARHLDARQRRPLFNFGGPEPTDADRAEWELAKRLTWREPISGPYRRESPRVGRNDPCPCGSGKKYKRCHGR